MRLAFAHTFHQFPRLGPILTHGHPVLELVYFTSGSGYTTFGGRDHEVHRNSFAVMCAETDHDQRCLATLDSICLGMAAPTGLEEFEGVWPDPDGCVRRACESVMREVTERQLGFEDIVNGQLAIISGLVKRIAAGAPEYDPKRALVTEALSIIEGSEGGISVRDLSEQLFVSRDYLRHLFREYHGETPMRAIIAARTSHAQELLVNRCFSIAQVAERCGFSSPYYFSRLFKRVTGLSPSQFRRQSTV